MKRPPALACVALALLLSAGCVRYELGSMLPEDIRSIHMPSCKNITSEPMIEQDVTRSILSQIQMDGALRLTTADQADAILEVTLIRCWLDPVGYKVNEAATVNEYRFNISASFVLYRRSDQSVVMEYPELIGFHDFDFAGDMTSSKNIALRPAADYLGRLIINKIVQYWP